MAQENDMVHDSLLVSIGAEVTKAMIEDNGKPMPEPHVIGNLTVKIVQGILDADNRASDVKHLEEVDALLTAITDMREKGQRREIASLAIMSLKNMSGRRSPTARMETLTLMMTYAAISPASVNNEHINEIIKGLTSIADALREATKAG